MVSSSATIAALLSTGFISLAPNLILLLFPGYGAKGGAGNSVFLSLGQALAAGGLLGDVFLHTLPHAHFDDDAGLWVLTGFTIFLTADLIIRSVDSTEKLNTGHSHHSRSGPQHNHSLALLNLAADSLHNFTDGLAIGATYASQKAVELSLASLLSSRGGLASLSILVHEVPHELGDYCSLLRAGFSKSQAILAQFVTAIAAFIGTIVALSAAEGWAGERLLFITSGGFVYLAATTILPEVLDEGPSAVYRFLHLCAFSAGIGFLYIVALLEHGDDHHGKSDHHTLVFDNEHPHAEL